MRQLLCLSLAALAGCSSPASRPEASSDRPCPPRFELSVKPRLLPGERLAGKFFVVLAPPELDEPTEPRDLIGHYSGIKSPPWFAQDLSGRAPVVMGPETRGYPYATLSEVPAGNYLAQAILLLNSELRLVRAPGNLYSAPKAVQIKSRCGLPVRMELDRATPADPETPSEENLKAGVRFFRIQSAILSRFRGNPVWLRAGVLLPKDWEKPGNRARRYGLRIHVGGYGSRYTRIQTMIPDRSELITVHLDGAGPFGDPYQVNSANSGPYADALVKELIPAIEREYRGLDQGRARGRARFLDGHSTGAWASLYLQLQFPDFFAGAWAFEPDPVDFRSFQQVNLYESRNLFADAKGKELVSYRDDMGRPGFTIRQEVEKENRLAFGGRYPLSGQQWGAWNAAFSPKAVSGQPAELFDASTGAIHPAALASWSRFDLSLRLRNQAGLRKKLRGKLRIYAADRDNYFLDQPVRLLARDLEKLEPGFFAEIRFIHDGNHGSRPFSDEDLVTQMLKVGRLSSGAP